MTLRTQAQKKKMTKYTKIFKCVRLGNGEAVDVFCLGLCFLTFRISTPNLHNGLFFTCFKIPIDQIPVFEMPFSKGSREHLERPQTLEPGSTCSPKPSGGRAMTGTMSPG